MYLYGPLLKKNIGIFILLIRKMSLKNRRSIFDIVFNFQLQLLLSEETLSGCILKSCLKMDQ